MKSKDWALIIMIVAIVGMASYFIVNALMPPPNSSLQTIPAVTSEIPSSVGSVPTSVFNQDAVSPAFPTNIGDIKNANPFASTKGN